MNLVPLGNIVSALVFAFIGIIIFVVAFVVMDKLTPYHLRKEIVQEHNMAHHHCRRHSLGYGRSRLHFRAAGGGLRPYL